MWEMAAEEIGSAPEGVTWLEVSDAGSNFFPYWATCRAHNKHFLIWVAQNRWVREQEEDVAHKLIDYARWLPAVAGSEHTISIPARKNQAVRLAEVQMAWAGVQVASSSQASPVERALPAFSAWVLRVWEPNPPKGVEGLEWHTCSPHRQSQPMRRSPHPTRSRPHSSRSGDNSMRTPSGRMSVYIEEPLCTWKVQLITAPATPGSEKKRKPTSPVSVNNIGH